MERIISLVKTMDIPVLSVPGYEADDIMATLSAQLANEDLEVILVSKDKDLEQLITDRVRLYDPGKDEFINAEALQASKGYLPSQAIEIQTLTGDGVDDIPGIDGVGLKTAARLIQQYGSAAAVVILLMWLLLSAYAVLIGAEINAELERQTTRDTTEGSEKPLGKRGAYAADTVGRSR